eukprot:TRINITY_DN112426_c0_g2_i1.p1 TRINITY_DN112426_c0_g2~~TRINITY_DN112426_c0_g2_i1.p1  ORF type:complete len:93 (+),score=17.84 TRINITY_DN112426_c0_g2_i1:40-279(+)
MDKYERVMPVSLETMEEERVPIEWRDYCAHILIPLNRCRVENYFLPWKCNEERHEYERCQYVEYQRRVRAKLLADAKNK